MFVKKAIKLKLSLEKTKQRRRCTSSVPEKDKVIVEGVNVVKNTKTFSLLLKVELLRWKRQFMFLT